MCCENEQFSNNCNCNWALFGYFVEFNWELLGETRSYGWKFKVLRVTWVSSTPNLFYCQRNKIIQFFGETHCLFLNPYLYEMCALSLLQSPKPPNPTTNGTNVCELVVSLTTCVSSTQSQKCVALLKLRTRLNYFFTSCTGIFKKFNFQRIGP